MKYSFLASVLVDHFFVQRCSFRDALPLLDNHRGIFCVNLYHNELYGRYIDEVFMTSNLSLDQIHLLLDEANDRDENIRITRPTSTAVQFLDVSMKNNQGRLRTMFVHKLAAEDYFVLFLSDYRRHMHRNVIQGALFRQRTAEHWIDAFIEWLSSSIRFLSFQAILRREQCSLWRITSKTDPTTNATRKRTRREDPRSTATTRV